MRYDPRNPPADAMVRTDSTHPAHSDLRETLVLLELGGVFFVVKGLNQWPCDLERLISGERYFYEEHTCPTNFARSFEAIVSEGDFDCHGIFKFVDVVWLTCEYEALEAEEQQRYLEEVFPALKAK